MGEMQVSAEDILGGDFADFDGVMVEVDHVESAGTSTVRIHYFEGLRSVRAIRVRRGEQFQVIR